MYLNRIFTGCAFALAALTAGAQDNDDNLTARLYYNTEYSMWGIDLGLENGQTYCTIQADLSLDMSKFEFDEESYAFTERAQTTRLGRPVDTHGLVSHVWDSGFMRILISSDTNIDIKGCSGTVVFLGLKVKDGAVVDTSAEYPVNITNIDIVHNETVDGKATATGNYTQGVIADPAFCCYDMNSRRPAIYGSITDGELEDFRNGVATSPWAVEADFTHCTMESLGRVAPEPASYNYRNRYNKNLLYYVNDRAQMSRGDENVVTVGSDGNGDTYTTEALTLHDDGKRFFSSFVISAERVGYDRVFTGGRWSTVCLPFSLPADRIEALRQDCGFELEELTGFEDGTLKFTAATEMKANRPYLIRTEEDAAPFASIEGGAEVSPSGTMDDIVAGGTARMRGSFAPETVVPTESTAVYGFSSATGSFVKVTGRGILNPFRACIEIPASKAQRASLAVRHPDGVTDIAAAGSDGGAADVDVYTLDGRMVRSSVKADTATDGLAGGVYLVDGRKVIVK